jgi:hypothetical protein
MLDNLDTLKKRGNFDQTGQFGHLKKDARVDGHGIQDDQLPFSRASEPDSARNYSPKIGINKFAG